jgi:hypothetical protein
VLGQLPARVTGGVLGVTSQVFGAVVSFLTVVVFTVYFLLDLPRLRHGVVRLFPVDRRERYGRVVDIMVNKVGDYMIGRLAIGFIAGVVAFAGLSALGVPYPLPLAIFIALLDLIPLIGHPIGSVAALIVALITKDLWPTTVLLAIIFLVYQQIEKLLHRAARAAPLGGHLRGRGAAGGAHRRGHPRRGRRAGGHPDRGGAQGRAGAADRPLRGEGGRRRAAALPAAAAQAS